MKRPPHNEYTKMKIARALRGRKRSEETRAKMAEAHRGKTHSEETKAAIRRGMLVARAGKNLTPHEKETLKAARKRADVKQARKDQLELDLIVARRLFDWELIRDLTQSKGVWARRRCHHGAVSDGVSGDGRVMWYPFRLDLRMREYHIRQHEKELETGRCVK